MAPSTIKKAIGAVKDQTSIRLAKVAGNSAPDLEVLVVKATTHGKRDADEKYAKEILNLMSCSRNYVNACVSAVSRRLSKTSDWIVALKALVLVHKLLNEGDPVFRQEMLFSSKRGARILNMSSFRDDAHSTSWDQSSFVRAYALYLDQKLEVVMTYGRKLEKKRNEGDEDEDGFRIDRRVKSYDHLNDSMRERKEVMWLKDLAPEKVLERLNQLLRVLDRFLASRPTGAAKKSRMVLMALHLLVKDSFRVYDDICDVLKYLLDCFLDLEYAYTVKAFDAYVNASKMMDELTGFYDWVKDVGIVRASEIPEVKKISDQLLGSLEGLLREKGNRPNSVNEIKDREESFSPIKDEREEEESLNEIKSLPPPENYNTTSTVSQPLHQPQVITEDLVNLKNEEEESNELALSLFSEWAKFPEGNKVSSPWDNPAAEEGRDDWEMVLVESASNLSMQKAEFGGGLDPLLLDGMYDLGTVKKEARAHDMSGGSASSVALPGVSRGVLALPPVSVDGVVGGSEDPFAASLSVDPPSYVQMADLERKQQLLVEEQLLWKGYMSNGNRTRGQVALQY